MEKKLTLVKGQESFKIVITPALERQIRFLCGNLPNNEYSGTLFYTVNGSFETHDLVITAVDFYLQDVGSGGATEFSNTSDLAGYMVDHELIGCYQGLMHSHNKMATFFSGTDINTLISEGTDANHFVSLIVNNAGVYTAAITRKVHRKVVGKHYSEYNSFNNAHNVIEDEFTQEDTYIEYFNLNVSKEEVMPESFLKRRLEELQKAKAAMPKFGERFNTTLPQLPAAPAKKEAPKKEEPTLFDGVVIDDTPSSTVSTEDTEEFRYNESAIKKGVAQVITGNIFAGLIANIDVNKWASNMDKTYDLRFKDNYQSKGEDTFKYYADNLIDALVEELDDDVLLAVLGDPDAVASVWASDMIDALSEFPRNKYLQYYIESLSRWI